MEAAKRQNDFQAFLSKNRQLINAALEEFLPRQTDPPQLVHEAIRYAVLGRAHRLRPLLVIATAEILGVSTNAVIKAAISVELIHSYILIVDDIVDNAKIRRSKRCCHLKYGMDIAQYACFLLSDISLDLLIKNANQQRVDADQLRIQMSKLREKLVTSQEMEHLLRDGHLPSNIDNLNELYSLKGGEWFAFLTSLTCQLLKSDEATTLGLTQFGRQLGIAYQIEDDIADVECTSKQMGKASGMDKLLKNYVTVFGLAYAKKAAKHAREMAIHQIESMKGLRNVALLLELLDYIAGSRLGRSEAWEI